MPVRSRHTDVFEESVVYMGGPQSGKTGRLIERACDLTKCGRGSVLYVCASSQEASDVFDRASARLDGAPIVGSANVSSGDARVALGANLDCDASSRLRVVDAESIALEIVSEPLATSMFRRTPRVLAPFEERFLLEDMRTASIKGRRLREVMEFICAGWSRLADDDPAWLITLEEEAIAKLLHDNLQFTGGILACELGNFAVNTLRADAVLRERHSYDHVLVDDLERLDRATQILTRMIARKSFTFAAGEMEAIALPGTYPYYAGIDEFLADHPCAKAVRLKSACRPADLAIIEERLIEAYAENEDTAKEKGREGELSGEPGAVSREAHDVVLMADDMGDELRTIERICQDALSLRQSVLIVGASRLWRSNAAKRLGSAGIPIAEGARRIAVKDFRDGRSCQSALAETRERLRRNSHDGVAWRSFVGFGDYIARSAGLEGVRAIALMHGLGIEEALARLSAGSLPGIDATNPLYAPLVDAYRRCRAEVEVMECAGVDESSSRMDVPGGIRIASPEEAAFLRADLVIFGGFVNGAIPSRDFLDGVTLVGGARERAYRADIRALYAVVGSARKRLILTGFKMCSLEAAERMGLHIVRIKLREGARVCELEPSFYAQLMVSDEALCR